MNQRVKRFASSTFFSRKPLDGRFPTRMAGTLSPASVLSGLIKVGWPCQRFSCCTDLLTVFLFRLVPKRIGG